MIPRAIHVVVYHDAECRPDACTCDPEIVIEPLTAETLVRGAQGEREWRDACRAEDAG